MCQRTMFRGVVQRKGPIEMRTRLTDETKNDAAICIGGTGNMVSVRSVTANFMRLVGQGLQMRSP